MRKNLKFILGMCFLFVCVAINPDIIKAKEQNVCDINVVEVDDKEITYDKQELKDIISVLPDCKQLNIGEMFQCYNANTCEVIRYIPIYNSKKCVYIATLEENNTFSISNDVEFINKVFKKFDNSETVLLYIDGDELYAEDEKKNVVVDEFPIFVEKNKKFHNSCFKNKINQLKKSENRVGTTRVTSPYSTKMELGLPYVTLTKSNENIHKCNITNFVRQEENNCWAATVATIVNYKKNKSLEAGDVNLAMGISWYLAGTVKDTKKALKHYGLSYSIKYGTPLSWVKVKESIGHKKPFCMGFISDAVAGHMVTGYGYATADKKKYIAIWDSNGKFRMLTYEESDSCITMYGYKFVWKDTVY